MCISPKMLTGAIGRKEGGVVSQRGRLREGESTKRRNQAFILRHVKVEMLKVTSKKQWQVEHWI